jgi:L-amino acid N-acyltransferase YncA
MTIDIAGLEKKHWLEVATIYAEGIATGHATFEFDPPVWERFAASHPPDHRYVAREDGRVLGWVAASPVSDRSVYSGVVEDSLYVAEQARGRGIGQQLLQALIASTEAAGIWTIQSGIFPENQASLRLHEWAGFRIVGTRERFGQMNLRAPRRRLARCHSDRTAQLNRALASRTYSNSRCQDVDQQCLGAKLPSILTVPGCCTTTSDQPPSAGRMHPLEADTYRDQRTRTTYSPGSGRASVRETASRAKT